MAEQLAAYTTPRQFAEGLRYLLDGIDHLAGRPPAETPGSPLPAQHPTTATAPK
jgi:hypothetical protein